VRCATAGAIRWLSTMFVMLCLLGGCNSEPEKPPLRVLTLYAFDTKSPEPADDSPLAHERALLQRFADSEGKRLEFVHIGQLSQLLPALLAGKGDLIASNFTVTDERKKQVNFSRPIAFVQEQVIARAGDRLQDAHDLGGRIIAVRTGSSHAASLNSILVRRFQPAFSIQQVDESVSDADILRRVIEGHYDLTVLDSNRATELLAQRDDLQSAFTLDKPQPIAWAMRPEDLLLLQRINSFLGEHLLLHDPTAAHTGDLERIKKRGVLRLATRNNAASYYLWRGEFYGFDYDLVRHFAEEQGVALEVLAYEEHDHLLDMVRDGRADIAAASLTITQKRNNNGITFSAPYHEAVELIVCRTDDDILKTVADLKGRSIVVRRSSSYWESLIALRQQGIKFTLIEAPEGIETEQLISGVASGTYDLTVADSHLLDIELTWRDDVKAAFPLGHAQPQGWAMRTNNSALIQAVNDYLAPLQGSLFYNVTYGKYFKNNKRIISHQQERQQRKQYGQISPYDDLVRRFAGAYGIDWLLLLAQVYQESRFDPDAKSWAGAHGLLQVLPETARQFGYSKLEEPENGLEAGAEYLSWLMQRFEPELDIAERTWFALAAYNAGIGHLRDARKLAQQQGLDPDVWFNNVEKAMLLLSQRKYYSNARYGYVRGEEPVDYVRKIRDRYKAYALISREPTSDGEALIIRRQNES